MALNYKNQSEIEGLISTLENNGATNYSSRYKSDLRKALMGNRPSAFKELHYVRDRTSDVEGLVPTGIEEKLSDTWIHNRASATSTVKRYTEVKQLTFEKPAFIN